MQASAPGVDALGHSWEAQAPEIVGILLWVLHPLYLLKNIQMLASKMDQCYRPKVAEPAYAQASACE